MSMHRRALGMAGEDASAEWYERAGFAVEARNWRCRTGEIDIVATRRDVLVVCEVKTRSSDRYGSGADAVDWRKQRTIRSVASQYLAQRVGRPPRRIRFDVAVVTMSAGGPSVRIIEAAF